MSRLPPGDGMNHKADPQYVTTLINDAANTFAEYQRVYDLGRDPDPTFSNHVANDLLSQAKNIRFALKESPQTFPPNVQQRIDTLMGKIQREVEGNPAFYIPPSTDNAEKPPLPDFPIEKAPTVVPDVHQPSRSPSQNPPHLIAFSDHSQGSHQLQNEPSANPSQDIPVISDPLSQHPFFEPPDTSFDGLSTMATVSGQTNRASPTLQPSKEPATPLVLENNATLRNYDQIIRNQNSDERYHQKDSLYDDTVKLTLINSLNTIAANTVAAVDLMKELIINHSLDKSFTNQQRQTHTERMGENHLSTHPSSPGSMSTIQPLLDQLSNIHSQQPFSNQIPSHHTPTSQTQTHTSARSAHSWDPVHIPPNLPQTSQAQYCSHQAWINPLAKCRPHQAQTDCSQIQVHTQQTQTDHSLTQDQNNAPQLRFHGNSAQADSIQNQSDHTQVRSEPPLHLASAQPAQSLSQPAQSLPQPAQSIPQPAQSECQSALLDSSSSFPTWSTVRYRPQSDTVRHRVQSQSQQTQHIAQTTQNNTVSSSSEAWASCANSETPSPMFAELSLPPPLRTSSPRLASRKPPRKGSGGSAAEPGSSVAVASTANLRLTQNQRKKRNKTENMKLESEYLASPNEPQKRSEEASKFPNLLHLKQKRKMIEGKAKLNNKAKRPRLAAVRGGIAISAASGVATAMTVATTAATAAGVSNSIIKEDVMVKKPVLATNVQAPTVVDGPLLTISNTSTVPSVVISAETAATTLTSTAIATSSQSKTPPIYKGKRTMKDRLMGRVTRRWGGLKGAIAFRTRELVKLPANGQSVDTQGSIGACAESQTSLIHGVKEQYGTSNDMLTPQKRLHKALLSHTKDSPATKDDEAKAEDKAKDDDKANADDIAEDKAKATDQAENDYAEDDDNAKHVKNKNVEDDNVKNKHITNKAYTYNGDYAGNDPARVNGDNNIEENDGTKATLWSTSSDDYFD